MTNKEYVKHLLDMSLQDHGENAFSTRMLRAQLHSLDRFQEDEPPHQFHVGARGEASEDLQPGEHREDMYGNPVLSPEKRAEAEESAN